MSSEQTLAEKKEKNICVLIWLAIIIEYAWTSWLSSQHIP